MTSGQSLPDVCVTYETYGQLNADRSNAVLVCHALSGDSHVAQHTPDDEPGWWEIMVGPGKPIDTDRYFVICSNVLGGCRGTTGPNSVNPETGKPYGRDFPVVTVDDMVAVQKKLIDHLEIRQLMAVVGGSLGGHQALAWATRYPDSVAATCLLATSPHLTSQALAFDVVGRNAILSDPDFAGGEYYDKKAKPDSGLAIARMLAHITYLSPQAMAQKFDKDRLNPRDIATEFEKKFSVGSYLAYQGNKFVERFDANSYCVLSMAMDLFELGRTHEDLVSRFKVTTCDWMVVSFTSDWLFPAFQSQTMVDALLAARKPVSYCNVNSPSGHDAFLLEDSFATYGEMARAFLDQQYKRCCGDTGTVSLALTEPADEMEGYDETSIFHGERVDFALLLALIEKNASVLDLGCGNGMFLRKLKERGHSDLVGLELDEPQIVKAMQAGLNVIQGDLNKGLPGFDDKQFDYVVLSQTLQTIVETQAIVNEILRVGRRCIVSFPNFAYRRLREAMTDYGRSPATEKGLLPYHWYDTPNRRFLSVKDWESFCEDRNIRIHHEVFFDTEEGEAVTDNPNLNADLAIYVISR